MRSSVILGLLLGLHLGWAAPARGAEAPLVVFYAPPGAPAEVLATRTALAEVVRPEGTTLLDLTPGPPAPLKAGENLRRAVEHYGGFRHGQALTFLSAALEEVERTGAAGLTPAELGDLFLYRAFVHGLRGDQALAWDDLVRAVVVSPTRRLDPLRFPPRAVESFQRAQAAVAGGAHGSIVFTDLPDACRVMVDARPIAGREAAGLPMGEHYVRIECEGAEPTGARLQLSQSLMTFRPDLRFPRPPTEADVVKVARTRGARTLVWIVASVAPPSPTVTMRLLATSGPGGPRLREETIASLADAPAALRAMVARLVRPEVRPAAAAPRPWWKSPWLWGAVAVAAGAAVVLPLALDDDPARVDLQVPGDPWR